MFAEMFRSEGENFPPLAFCYVSFFADDKPTEAVMLEADILRTLRLATGFELSGGPKDWRTGFFGSSSPDYGALETFRRLSASAASLVTAIPDYHLWWDGPHETGLDADNASQLWLAILYVNQNPCFVSLNDYPALAYLDVFCESALLCEWIANKLEMAERENASKTAVTCTEAGLPIRMRPDAVARSLKSAGCHLFKRAGRNYCYQEDADTYIPKLRALRKKQQQEEKK